MKRSEIRTRIAEAIDDKDSIFFTSAQINLSIDEAMELFAERTKSIRRSAYVSLRPGATFYFTASIAQDIMFPYRIWNQANNQRLIATSINELDSHSTTWLDTSGDPRNWFAVSWDFFGVYPHAAAGGGVMRVDYVAWPLELQDDDDEPELPEGSTDVPFLHGLYEGELKQWDIQSASLVFALLTKAMGESEARTGMSRVQERSFQRMALNFPSEGVGRGNYR